MAEVGCLKDGYFQNLVVENTTIFDTADMTLGDGTGTITIDGNLSVGGGVSATLTIGSTSTSDVNYVSPTGLSPVMITHSTATRAAANGGHYPSIMGTVDNATLAAYDMPSCEALFCYLSNLDSLSTVQSTHLFGNTAGASLTSTITEAAAGALDGDDGYATNLTPQFLTGDWSTDKDIGAANPFFDGGDDIQHLIIFGGNNSTGTGVLTFSLSGSDGFDASASSIAVTGAGDQVFTVTAAADDAGSGVDITLTPEATTKILKGSFIYLEHTAGNIVAARGYIKVSGGTLTPAIAVG